MEKKKKTWSLSRTVVLLIMAGYSGVLALLLIMDMYLISDYQANIQEKNHQVLNTHAEAAGDALTELDKLLYNIYSTNSDFSALYGAKDPAQQYGYAYDVYTEIKISAILSDTLDIGYVFYDNCQLQLSYNESEKISGETRRFIGSQIQAVTESQRTVRTAFSTESEDENYRVIVYKKGGIAIAGVYNLSRAGKEIAEDLGEDPEVLILDMDHEAVMHEAVQQYGLEEYIQSSESQFSYWQDSHYLYGQRMKNTNIWIVMALPSSIWTYMNFTQMVLLVISAFSIFVILLLYRLIRRELVMPLRDLMDTMNKIRKGDWKAEPEGSPRFEEIRQVNETLIAMVGEIEKQKMRSYEETIEKQKAKLQYLQLQLKPHFYLNGLKLLNTLVIEDKKKETQDLIIGISMHLRYLLQTEREMVSLKSEVDFVRNYIELYKNMYERPIEYQISVDHDIDGWQVPTLCIQTFVENSVKYTKQYSGRCTLVLDIKVHALKTEDGEFLDIMVSDNGQGYPEEVLGSINGEAKVGDSSVGINNLKRRCLLLYEKNVECTFFNADGAYSELILPRRG